MSILNLVKNRHLSWHNRVCNPRLLVCKPFLTPYHTLYNVHIKLMLVFFNAPLIYEETM